MRYAAPEQFSNAELGPWTDLYAVGVMAFELLTGRVDEARRVVADATRAGRYSPELDDVNQIMLIGTVVWFIATPLWMGRELDIDASEVEI